MNLLAPSLVGGQHATGGERLLQLDLFFRGFLLGFLIRLVEEAIRGPQRVVLGFGVIFGTKTLGIEFVRLEDRGLTRVNGRFLSKCRLKFGH